MSEVSKPIIPLIAVDDGSGYIACRFYSQSGVLVEEVQESIVVRGAAHSVKFGGMSNSIWDTEEGSRFSVSRSGRYTIDTCEPHNSSSPNETLL